MVTENADGFAVDIDATWNNRDRVRQAFVPTKKLYLRDVATTGGFIAVAADKKQWKCTHCNTGLGSVDDDWKAGIEPRRRLLADLFDAVQTQVRRRQQQPVYVAERYCPACASSLSIDIEVKETERTPPGFTFGCEQPQAAE